MQQSCLRRAKRTGDNCTFYSRRHFDGLRGKVKHELSVEHKEKGCQDQLVVLIVETSKLYRPSEPTSTILVRASFVLRDFCYSRQGLPFNSR